MTSVNFYSFLICASKDSIRVSRSLIYEKISVPSIVLTGPAGPVGPITPFWPGWPGIPDSPCGPGGPDSPRKPRNPCGPVQPIPCGFICDNLLKSSSNIF